MSKFLKAIPKWLRWTGATLALLIFIPYCVLAVAMKLTASGVGFPNEAHDAVYAESLEPHRIKLIDSGISSLFERLALIDSAKKSIELEFFIFNIDQSSRLLTQKLIEKANQGVKIRLLVDFSAPVFQLRPAYAHLMKSNGIEIKYYNTSSLYRFFSVQHRSHRKLLIIDEQKVITGGRNIADDYFDLSTHYNFLDSDVKIEGPVVKTIRASFDLYWNSAFSMSPESVEATVSKGNWDEALSYFNVTAEDKLTLNDVMTQGRLQAERTEDVECRDIIFVTDFPERGEAHRKIYPTLVKLVSEAKEQILVESPYFVIRQEGHDVLKSLGDRNVKLKVLTNGLYSTDAYYVISALITRLSWIAETGLELSVFDGLPLQNSLVAGQKSKSDRWGVHAKRAVIDGSTAMIGTYNIDPRSANLNSELMVVCRNNPAFAKQVADSILQRMAQSTVIISERQVKDSAALTANATFKQKLLTWLAFPLATTFDLLL